jgi:hypothetical protein
MGPLHSQPFTNSKFHFFVVVESATYRVSSAAFALKVLPPAGE